MTQKLVLASGSVHRRALLEQAGLAVTAEPSTIDERAVELTIDDSGMGPDDVATVLAEAKACEVSERFPDALVIGADQTLSLAGEVLHKPADMEAARRRLIALSGRRHFLNSAVVLAAGGQAVWRHVESPAITMRAYDPGFVGRYLARVGDEVLSTVGAYQVEREGAQLMAGIDGDYFSVIGLPLLPLLAELRQRGAIDG